MTGMTWGRRLALGAAAVTAIAAAAPATATKMVATYSGVVTAGRDVAGIFGGGELAGKSYSVEYLYNTEDFMPTEGIPDSHRIEYNGVSEYKLILSNYSILGYSNTFIYMENDQPADNGDVFNYLSHGATGSVSGGKYRLNSSMDAYGASRDFLPDASLSQPISYKREINGNEVYSSSSFTFEYPGSAYWVTGTWMNFQSLSVSVQPAATAVPEPASWALMLTGFAVIGASLRVRRRRVMFA